MKGICSCYRKMIGGSAASVEDHVFHGLCEEGCAHSREPWGSLSLQEHLDRFDVPLPVVTDTCLIFAVKQAMNGPFGRPTREIHRLPGE